MKIINVKGGYDYLPKEQQLRNYINNILKETFEQFGYNPIETPILCYYDILKNKYDQDSDILKEIYQLSDQGNRKLGLRYDLTVPFAKFIALNKNQIKIPFKRYEISKVFRDGPIKKGRDREFTQCDVDVVGIEGQFIESELLLLYKEAFDKLKIDIIIKYNSRKLMNGLITESNINQTLINEVVTIIDKKEKITKQEFINNLLQIGLNNNQINNLIKYLNMPLSKLNETFKETKNETLKNGLIEINNLNDYINELGLKETCIFTPTLARGQNYYTGNIFEVYDKDKTLNCSIGGGGRYDNMITEFINDNTKYPAVGISFGLTAIYEILKNKNIYQKTSNIDIYIIPINTNIQSLKIANKLRQMGYKTQIEMQNKKIKKCLEYADKEKIKYVAIIGEDEIKTKTFKLKDMLNRKEYIITNIKTIKNIIND